ncbi:MAG: hypothetical protein ACTSYL_11920 [Candidatus Thorarchaeota archaeon]
MSHREGTSEQDAYDMDPKEVLTQYSVEWVALRKSYEELKTKLQEVKEDLLELDRQLQAGEITETEHLARYKEKWLKSTELVQVKREVESRLYEIQKQIRAANRQLRLQEEERARRERIEQEKSNAMIEWMSLRQGFDLISQRRKEINQQMDELEKKRRAGTITDEEYRRERVEQIGQLAELRTVESDVKRRLGELLEIIRS